MRDINAAQLLAKVMNWKEQDPELAQVPELQLLADFKYDHYQRFGPGRKFIESLALWLNTFDGEADRTAAYDLVRNHLIFISNEEFSHLVQTAYPDLILQERMRLVAEEKGIPGFRVMELSRDVRFRELKLKSLYLGLSDGARTNELRRFSNDGISNEQIWQAYELGDHKSSEMLEDLDAALKRAGVATESPKFNLIWLLDDFSGSGNTYIRFDQEKKRFKGKIQKIYDQLHRGGLIDPANYEVFLLLYVATQQAMDHIEFWAERFTTERGYKPLQIRVLCPIDNRTSLKNVEDFEIQRLLGVAKYFDSQVDDTSMKIGGTDGRLGFANCALPLVLSHNTPNNSVYLLWGPEGTTFEGLFPRISRHRDS